MFGIGILNPKYKVKMCNLIRDAYMENASFVFTIGRRYKKKKNDNGYDGKIPVFHFDTFDAFRNGVPQNLQLVLVENNVGGVTLSEYTHPENAVYLIVPEYEEMANELIRADVDIIELPKKACHSIVMYDRKNKKIKPRTNIF